MADQETENPEKGSSSKKWLMLGLGSVGSIAAGAVTLYLLGFGPPPPQEIEEEVVPQGEINEVVRMDPLIVNLADEDEIRYARIGVSLGVHNPNRGTPLIDEELMVPKVKDRFLAQLTGRTGRQLLDPQVKEELRQELSSVINELVEPQGGKVLEVYFTEFIIQ